MILRFLSLFSAFRALREALQQETTRALLLQDRLDAAGDDRARMWETLQEALRGERTAYQMGINYAVQPKGYGTPYPDAPHIPAHAVPQEQDTTPIGRRPLPSEAMATATRQFIQSYSLPRQ